MSRRFPARRRDGGRMRRPRAGQYMVEFALAIVVFSFVLVSFIELGLAAFNYRMMNAAALNAARLGIKGASDDEMKQQILQQTGKLYPTAFLKVDFGPRTVEITPPYPDRMEGTVLTVRIDLVQGASLAGWYCALIELPIAVKLPMACDVYVDTDRDGQGDFTDADDDNDGFSDLAELAAETDPRNAGAHP